MGKLAIFLCLAAVWAAFGRFPFAPPFLAERAGGATGQLLAAGLLTVAIAAAARKRLTRPIFLWRGRTS